MRYGSSGRVYIRNEKNPYKALIMEL